MKSVLWRAVKRLSYIQDARCLKVNMASNMVATSILNKQSLTANKVWSLPYLVTYSMEQSPS